jgi:tetratricopeptide (TPR) repeat protein
LLKTGREALSTTRTTDLSNSEAPENSPSLPAIGTDRNRDKRPPPMKHAVQAHIEMDPRQMRRVLRHCVVAIILALVIAGCSKKSEPASIQATADGYFRAGKYDEAKIEYTQLLRADAGNATAFHQIGLIWYEQGAPMQAIPYLLKSRELSPADVGVRVRLARAMILMGDIAAARKEALAILEKAPADDEAIVLLAETAGTKEAVASTEEHLQKMKEPDRAAVHLASAALFGRKGDIATAEAEIQKALSLDPKSVTAHLAMANLLLAKKDTARAGDALKTAADLSPPRSPARIRLAEFKVRSGAVDEGKALLKQMTEQTRDYLPAWLLLARIAVAEKKYDESLALLENVTGRDHNNIEAGLLQAQVWSAKGEAKKAIETLERLRSAYPKLPAVQFRIAQSHLQDGNPARAGLVLKELVAAQPDYVEAALLLGEIHLRTGERQAVVDSMTGLLKKHPALPQAQLLLADAYRALGRLDDAAAIFRQQIQAAPRSAAPHFLLGIVLRQKGSLPEARAAFEKAQELAPDNLQATAQLVELDILAKDFDAAQKRVQLQIQRKPGSAEAHFLSGRIYAAQRAWDRAEAPLLKAIELDANATQPYDLLMSTYLAAGKLDEALRRMEAKLSAKPDDRSALLGTAIVYEKMKTFPKARDAYEKLLAGSPDFVPALNNLAIVYAERLNQPDKAYELARKARTLVPENPAVADTLGWILYKRGDYQQALPLFEESLVKLQDNPEVQFHLGMARYMMGQTEAAKTDLQKALATPDDFPGKEDARTRLALLGDSSGKPGGFSSAELEALLKEQPGDIPARVRLGETYETEGAFEKAAAAFEEAVNRDPKQLQSLLKLAQLHAGPLKNGARALEFARRARSLAPNDPKVAEILRQVSTKAGNLPGAYDKTK